MELCMSFHDGEERDPLLCTNTSSRRDSSASAPKWRWFALLAFSLFSISSGLMWDTFAPCVYIFVDYYFEAKDTWTTNAINSLSSIYMLLYPFVIQATFGFFEDRGGLPGSGLKRGLLIGAFINMLAGATRCLGAVPSIYGFAILSLGQVLAAIAQGFMLAVPPQLASAWFPETEVNLATSLAVSANNLGVAIGCVWTPLVVKAPTMHQDIPRLLFLQALICVIAFILIWASFKREPPFCEKLAIKDAASKEQSKQIWRQRSFHCMMLSYGIVMGAQCAIITLLAQILLPPFRQRIDESFVGYLGFAMLVIGLPASILAGFYLDRTLQYRSVCLVFFAATFLSVAGLYIATEVRYLPGVTASCILFGFSSYAIAPAIFQYASEMYYPVSEIIPTGYLLTSGNAWGVLLVFLMGWSEDTSDSFSMRIPLICLVIISFGGLYSMAKVKGQLKRLEALRSKPL